MSDKISVIIPSFNEEKNIANSIRSAGKGQNTEIIVVDGGSRDETRKIASSEGAKTLQSYPGRAVQMNRGTEAATGRIFLFLHADTVLPKNFDSEVRCLLKRKNVAAGAFLLKTDYDIPIMRVLERLIGLRSKWMGTPYGDQGIFIKKEIFQKTGGFPLIPIMEDFAYIKKLRKHGEIAVANSAVITSGRRWREFGILKTTLVNQILIAGYLMGVSPSKLNNLRRKLHKRASS